MQAKFDSLPHWFPGTVQPLASRSSSTPSHFFQRYWLKFSQRGTTMFDEEATRFKSEESHSLEPLK